MYIIVVICVIGLDGVGYGQGPGGGLASKVEGSTCWWPFSDNIVEPDGGGYPLWTDFHLIYICVY